MIFLIHHLDFINLTTLLRFMDQYGDFDEGALDGEDIEGYEEETGARMEQLLEEADQARLYFVSLLGR